MNLSQNLIHKEESERKGGRKNNNLRNLCAILQFKYLQQAYSNSRNLIPLNIFKYSKPINNLDSYFRLGITVIHSK